MAQTDKQRKRNYVNQTEIPVWPLEDALRIPRVIDDKYGQHPTKPLHVAKILKLSPSSGHFRTLCGSASAYGLTTGGYNAGVIALTELGRRIVAPTREGDDRLAKREASLQPRISREFLTRYNNRRLPQDQIARNVLVEMGVPADRADKVYELVKQNARSVGVIVEVKGQAHVDLETTIHAIEGDAPAEDRDDAAVSESTIVEDGEVPIAPAVPPTALVGTERENRRVFITHGQNRTFIDPLKELLTLSDYEPVVSIERETVSKPVPDKFMDDMRSCVAAVIHVDQERALHDENGGRHVVLNENVLIEIGAAMALYRRRFVLLVKEGIQLPSNLQGLYEVRYGEEGLDAATAIKVLKALKSLKDN